MDARKLRDDTTDVAALMLSMGKAARAAARTLATSPESVRNAALHAMAAAIRVNAGQILKANAADIASAKQRKLADSFIERMTLNEERIEAMAAGIEAIAAWANDGVKPQATEGKDFFDTGVALVTDKPAEGVPSISVEEGKNLCWG